LAITKYCFSLKNINMGFMSHIKFGSLASNGKGLGKALSSAGGGLGEGLGGIFTPFLAAEQQIFGQVDGFFSSPLMYGMLGIGGLVILSTIFKGASVANNGIGAIRENPEIAAMAIKAAQSGL
jgi:hypothetical protein